MNSGALAATALAASLIPAAARADDCPQPPGYSVTEIGRFIYICASATECPSDRQLVRYDLDTGEAVLLTACVPHDNPQARCYDTICPPPHCYVDECVPQGRYAYGFAQPYSCGAAAGTFEVKADVVACVRTEGLPAPTAFAGKLPWDDVPECECSFQLEPFCACSAAGAALPGTALIAALLAFRRRH